MKIILALLLVALTGCEASYFRCPECSAAYRQAWYQTGLPGTRWKYECQCGGKLIKCNKEESGWRDDVVPTLRGK
jgi:hypothetical protein